VKNTLKTNGYPEWMFTIPKKAEKKKEVNKEPSARKPSVGMPYIRGTSEQLHRIFRKHGVNMYHRPYNSIRSQLTKVKDKTDKMKQCGIVYHVTCANCKEDYIGETGRTLETRMKEHKTRSSSALHEHCDNTGHNIKAENTTILTSEEHLMKRKVWEAIAIKQRRPSLNRDEGLELPPVYNTLLLSHDHPTSRDQSH